MPLLNRRSLLATGALAALPLAAPGGALAAAASGKKDSVVLALTLEPPGLDPTASAASSISEVVLYNVFETLTKINADGSVSPLLAESWEVSPTSRPPPSGCAGAWHSTTASRSMPNA